MKLSEILDSRGYVHQHSADVAEITDGAPRVLYLGVDPSADSLHAGHLQMMLVLRHFLEAGHKVILLIGGGTGMIGDPSGKSSERVLLDDETIAANVAGIQAQTETLLGSGDFEIVNNASWLGEAKLLEFLRDVGKHFSVNDMLRKDSVRTRLEGEGQSISFTEFSYQLLQAYDFLHLHQSAQCDVQIGASDQWGNISAGIDLVRRKTGDTVYGLTAPLLVNKATGKKFGKSETGTVWLDAKKMSPFAFYQFWLNTEDEALEEYLKKMTLLPLEEISRVMEIHAADPARRVGQSTLARAVTEMVHGSRAASSAASVAKALFGELELESLDASEIEMLQREAPHQVVQLGAFLADVLVEAHLASSKREARQFLSDGAVQLNGARVRDANRKMLQEDFQNAPIAVLRRGKRHVCILSTT